MIDRRTLLGTALAGAAFAASGARADAAYPDRIIKLIVPFPPGGPVDVMARLIAQYLSTSVGQVIIENRPGAGGTLAGKAVAISDPDGYTLLLGSSAALAIGPALYPNPGYDPRTSFVSVAMLSSVPYVMIGAVNAPFKTVPELLAYAKANPGKLNFGVPNGAPPHMLAEMFKMQTGADVVIVPYKGASTLIVDLLAGRIHAGFETTSVMFGHLHEGKIRGLAVIRDQRLPALPELPTLIESGIKGVVGSSWTSIVAPAGTPPDVVAKLRAGIIAGLKSANIQDKLKMLGADASFLSPEECAAFVADEYDRIGAIMRAANIKGS
jgi:tripartite-type tricarboxylate transporter receptor subunit TctC